MTESFILVIDDVESRLTSMVAELNARLVDVAVEGWLPQPGEDHFAALGSYLDRLPDLIVADHDLSISSTSLSGSTISSWSQRKFIPVCNYSRQRAPRIPREVNFFELRVPNEGDDSVRAEYVVSVLRGFRLLRSVTGSADGDQLSASALLALAMGNPDAEMELEPYIAGVGASGSDLFESLRQDGIALTASMVRDYHVYLLGHVLMNAVLRFPGPVLSLETVAAYCALGAGAWRDLATIFESARYDGPFSGAGEFFWRSGLDRVIDEIAGASSPGDESAEWEVDEYYRSVVTRVIGREVSHDCARCGGQRGGYWCPFSKRPTCNRSECSVVSAPWVPRGATLCRVERDYYDMWAPLLGE